MRILVLQLARFGDIYQTWPTLNALKRQYPEAELHVLIRQRFREALDGFPGIVEHCWPTVEILEPIFLRGSVDEALQRLRPILGDLEALAFDRVINLSFSPLSSFITDFLSRETTVVTGYTRHSDGFLSLPDDASAYFFAQGEIGRSNRFHITSIFASVAQVDLQEEDFRAIATKVERKAKVMIHLGASQSLRIYPAELWVKFLKSVVPTTDCEWILVGAPNERAVAETVCSLVGHPRLKNQCGSTSLPELMKDLSEARMLVGCDSAPAQMASLVQTPVLQLSSATANFWTTGPTSAGSRVVYSTSLDEIPPERIAAEALSMLASEIPAGPCALRIHPLEQYSLHKLQFDDFAWNLIEALYTQNSYPRCEREEDLLAFQRLFELAELALQHIDHLNDPDRGKTAREILDQIDPLITEVGRQNRNVDPLVQWFDTERLRMPPGSSQEIFALTKKLFTDLLTITSVYRRFSNDLKEVCASAVELCRQCAPAIRNFQFAEVQDQFQKLVSTLHELSRHSTKVGERDWSVLLHGLNVALDRRDLIELADQLEYEVVPALS